MWWKAALLLAIPALHAQVVEGVVTMRGGAPASGVSVTLTGAKTYTVFTDGSGEYRFDGVAPGQYTTQATLPGFVLDAESMGSFRAREGVTRRSLLFVPLFTASGRVVYPDGKPAAQAQVYLIYGAGAIQGRTDAQGRFTISTVMRSRKYALRAAAPSDAIAADGEAWAPTYFPSVLTREEAAPIVLSAGVEASGHEIRLRSVPVFRVRGVARDDLGKAAAGVVVRLVSMDWGRISESGTASDGDGAFKFPAVRAGEWQLAASLKRDGVELRGESGVTVARKDLEGVQLRLARPFVLRGSVDRNDSRGTSGRGAASMVSLVAETGRSAFGWTTVRPQNGVFAIRNVYPGRYRIQPLGSFPGHFMASVTLGEREVLGEYVAISESSPPFLVRYEDNAPHVTGRIEKGGGAVVILIPTDASLRIDPFVRTQRVGDDGRFDVGTLRPGEYYALAFDRVDDAALHDPAFVAGVLSRAVRVRVAKGERVAIDLKVLPWPE